MKLRISNHMKTPTTEPRLPPTGIGPVDAERAHAWCSGNAGDVAYAGRCGCFSCAIVFDARLVKEFLPDAICPFCSIDSIVPDSSQFPMEHWFLELMRERWFGH
jgi:hypothetical protein